MAEKRNQTKPQPCESSATDSLRGVIFDCDGVLIDSREANVRFYNLILEALGLPEMAPEDEDYVHSRTVMESLRHIVPHSELERAFQEAGRISYKAVLPWIRLQDGLIQALERLRSKGVPCAINTNRTGTMGLVLDQFGLRPYFSPVVTANTVQHPKPHPESLYWILSAWELTPENVVFIGDTDVDCRTAAAAGVPFWAFQNGDLAAKRHIGDHREVADAIEKRLEP
ncbi:MAG: HAD family hydrolase [Desulfohalobiaceae bacterium]|nr:HAD family hydrolase [Desulfohalobiaceae bacterium]